MRFALCLVVLTGILLTGCESRPADGTRMIEDPDLSPEEQAEIDALIDSARTVRETEEQERAWASPEPSAEGALQGAAGGGRAPSDPMRARPSPEALHFATYRNDAYGYTFEYPDNLLQWGESIGGDRGQSFETADGTAILLVYASEADGANALRRQYETELARSDQDVTYERVRPDWFVVSGYEGDYVFYQRTFQTGEGLRTFRLRHLARDTDYFRTVTERLSHSFGS